MINRVAGIGPVADTIGGGLLLPIVEVMIKVCCEMILLLLYECVLNCLLS